MTIMKGCLDVLLLLTFLMTEVKFTSTQKLRVLNLDCGNAKIKTGVRRINLGESEECFLSGRIYCLLEPSEDLKSVQMIGRDTYVTSAVFPVDTWTTGTLAFILDNSEVTIAANTSAYRYLLPRSFKTDGGKVDVACTPYTSRSTFSSVYTESTTIPVKVTEKASIATGYIILIVIVLLLLIALVVASVVFFLRKYKLRRQGKPTTSMGLFLKRKKQKQNQPVENTYSPKTLGAAVYVDPAAPGDYDNKDEESTEIQKPTSGEYSYTYSDQPLFPGKSQPGQPTKSADGQTGNSHAEPVNRQVSEIPYEDVENDEYSYAYSSALKR